MPKENSYNLVNKETARSIAENILFSRNIYSKSVFSDYTSRSAVPDQNLKQIDTVRAISDKNNIEAFYIIKYKNGGFLILSGDRRVTPILAYSDKNDFQLNYEDYPIGVNDVLSVYRQAVEYARDKNITPSQEIDKQWNDLLNGNNIVPFNEPPGGGCEGSYYHKEALLQTTWGGDCGYNDYTETLNGAPCNMAWTGCVPTAMGQVIRYYEYPNYFDYANMADVVNGSGQSPALAVLLGDIYGHINLYSTQYGSYAYPSDIPACLEEYFDYSSASFSTSWNSSTQDIAKSEIGSNHPIILSGSNSTYGGHTWVVDGYRDLTDCSVDQHGNCICAGSLTFHCNWGWSGYEDGWYSFDNFDPTVTGKLNTIEMCYYIRP